MTLMETEVCDSGALRPSGAEWTREEPAPRDLELSAKAIVFEGNRQLALRRLDLTSPEENDLIVDILWSGVSTGTERLLWTGEMPPFPGMGYPLVPGYEAVGRIVGASDPDLLGRFVFVPGAHCFKDANGLFGATASRLIVPADRAVLLDGEPDAETVLLALAATAYHAIEIGGVPELIVGHGVLGRLLARIATALGGAPTVWEIDPARREPQAYEVLDPAEDPRTDYRTICDVSGAIGAIDQMITHSAKGAVITLAGFYKDRPSFAFPPAFMKEITLKIAAEWTRADLDAVLALRSKGQLVLDRLITHRHPPERAEEAYRTAFEDAACLKMIIDWRDPA